MSRASISTRYSFGGRRGVLMFAVVLAANSVYATGCADGSSSDSRVGGDNNNYEHYGNPGAAPRPRALSPLAGRRCGPWRAQPQ